MKTEKKIAFIFLWRLNDWGLYKRRHEAFARELAERDCVQSVLHIEYVSLRGLLSLMLKWVKEKDRSLRRIYATHIKKGFSLRPVAADNSNKLFIYSAVFFYAGKNAPLKKISDIAKRMQYGMLNRFFNDTEIRKVLLVYPPSKYFPEAIKSIKHDVLIADLVDDDISRAVEPTKKMQLIENYKNILPDCRWIFSTSPLFKETYKEYAKQPIDYLPNGVDIKRYLERPQENNHQRNEKKTIGYVGIMNKEVNMELLEYIISRNKNIDFVLVGQATDERLKDIKGLTSVHKNLFYLGPKSHDEVLDFMEKCDVLINIKNNDHTTSGADAIKIYEYLATGKPIVASPMPPADRFAELMYVTADKIQYSEFIKAALAENDSELRRKRMKVAGDNTWDKRVDVILERVSHLTNMTN